MNAPNPYGDYALPYQPAPAVNIQAVMKLVYVWMGLGLLVTTFVAWFTVSSPALLELRGSTGALLFAIVLEFGLVIALSAGLTRKWLTPNLAGGLFFLYAAVNGFVLSIIALVFDVGAITTALSTTVLLFGVMSIFGYYTKTDLTRMGSYLMMGVIGLVIAMFVNIFLNSGPMDYIISFVGVVIFTGLTAYDTQKIRNFTQTYQLQADGNLALKFSIYGALVLYLDFVNLFLFLLRLFGGGSRR